MKEQFQNVISSLKNDVGVRAKVADVIESAIRELASEHHLEGDDVLRAVAKAKETLIRDTDNVVDQHLLKIGVKAALNFLADERKYTDELANDLKRRSEELILSYKRIN